MRNRLTFLALTALAIALAGCPRPPPLDAVEVPDDAVEAPGEAVEVNDEAALVPARPGVTWLEKDIKHNDATISLGFLDRREVILPTAEIKSDGKPLASAMVFAQVVSADGEPLSEEVATRFDELYEGKLPRPKKGVRGILRFRIVLPDETETLARDVPLP
jgi:hypothetical protein